MTDQLNDVWANRDYPVLREITRQLDESSSPIHPSDLNASLGMSADVLQSALQALRRRGFIEVEAAESYGGGSQVIAIVDVAGAAYLVTGLHPDTDEQLSGLVQLLQQAAEQSPDEDERTRLRRAADAIGSVSRDVMVGVMTAYATKYGVH